MVPRLQDSAIYREHVSPDNPSPIDSHNDLLLAGYALDTDSTYVHQAVDVEMPPAPAKDAQRAVDAEMPPPPAKEPKPADA